MDSLETNKHSSCHRPCILLSCGYPVREISDFTRYRIASRIARKLAGPNH